MTLVWIQISVYKKNKNKSEIRWKSIFNVLGDNKTTKIYPVSSKLVIIFISNLALVQKGEVFEWMLKKTCFLFFSVLNICCIYFLPGLNTLKHLCLTGLSQEWYICLAIYLIHPYILCDKGSSDRVKTTLAKKNNEAFSKNN